MRKFNFALAFVAGAIIFSGCALSKMVKLAADQDLQVDPNPLEIHGGKVPFTMSAVLPPKMLPTGKVYTINTIYQYGDVEVAVGSIEFKASDFPNSSSTTSTKTADLVFPYEAGMSPGTLYVEGVASDPKSGKKATSPRMAVAQGLVNTSSLVKTVGIETYAPHGYNDKEELIPTNVNFYFAQGRSSLNPSLTFDGTSNRSKTNNLSAFIAEKNVTKTVTITGTHSPEGSERINKDLSEDRAKAIEDFYRKQMKSYDYKGMAESITFIIKPVVEDWNGFKNALRNSSIAETDKSKAMQIVNGTGSFEDKEKELRKLGSYETILKDLYPSLRTAQTAILTVKPKKSNAEIAVLAKQIVGGSVSSDTLSIEELMFAATLTPALDEKIGIYKAATKSGSWEAHNNLGAAYIAKAKKTTDGSRTKMVQDAITQLEIAANKSKSAMIAANMGAAYAMQGDSKQALGSIVLAEERSPSNATSSNLSAMKGALLIEEAKYAEAKASFASAAKDEAVTFNLGLAQLLTGELSEAKTTLGTISKSETLGAEANYLIAVASARQNQVADLTSSLKTAVMKDPSLKEKALNDLEFNKYADAVAKAVK